MAGKALVASCCVEQLGKVRSQGASTLLRANTHTCPKLRIAKGLSMQCDDSELFCVPSLSAKRTHSEVSDLVTVRSTGECAEDAANVNSRIRTQPHTALQPVMQSTADTELSGDLATGNSSDTGVVSLQDTSYSSSFSSQKVHTKGGMCSPRTDLKEEACTWAEAAFTEMWHAGV